MELKSEKQIEELRIKLINAKQTSLAERISLAGDILNWAKKNHPGDETDYAERSLQTAKQSVMAAYNYSLMSEQGVPIDHLIYEMLNQAINKCADAALGLRQIDSDLVVQVLSELAGAESGGLLSEMLDNSSDISSREKKEKYDNALNSLFISFSIGGYFSSQDTSEILSMVNGCGQRSQNMIASALTVSLLKYFDIEKIKILISLCKSEFDVVRARSLVGLVIALTFHIQRIDETSDVYKQIKDAVNSLNNSNFKTDTLYHIALSLYLSGLTPPSKQSDKDLLSEVGSFVNDMIKETGSIDSVIENLQEEGEGSDLVSKMMSKGKEWSKNASIGYDIYSGMKINRDLASMLDRNVSLWFDLFTNERHELDSLGSNGSEFLVSTFSMIEANMFMSSIDKYSQLFEMKTNIERLPGNIRSGLQGMQGMVGNNPNNEYIVEKDVTTEAMQFVISLKKFANNVRNSDFHFANRINEYKHTSVVVNTIVANGYTDLYLSNLYKAGLYDEVISGFLAMAQYRKETFYDMIASSLIIPTAEDIQCHCLVIWSYFKKKMYTECLEFMSDYDCIPALNADNLSNLGPDIKDKTYNYVKAKADCYNILGRYEDALKQYVLAKKIMNRMVVMRRIIDCQMNLGQWEEALNELYALKYMVQESENISLSDYDIDSDTIKCLVVLRKDDKIESLIKEYKNPSEPKICIAIADYKMTVREENEAISLYFKALQFMSKSDSVSTKSANNLIDTESKILELAGVCQNKISAAREILLMNVIDNK